MFRPKLLSWTCGRVSSDGYCMVCVEIRTITFGLTTNWWRGDALQYEQASARSARDFSAVGQKVTGIHS